MNKIAYNKYKENSVYTATKEELTLMLYNGLIKFLMQSLEAIDKKQIEIANDKIIRSQSIINEFINTSDMNYKISKEFVALYEYMNRRLLEANIKKDKEIIEEVLGYAKDFRDSWVKAMKIAKMNNPNNKSWAAVNE